MELLVLLIIVGVVCGFIGMAVGDHGGKNNGNTGFILGFLLGPIGILIAAVLAPAEGNQVKSKAQPPADATQRKIAEMEKQLAELKGTAKPAGKSIIKPLDDDASIPTYKLD